MFPLLLLSACSPSAPPRPSVEAPAEAPTEAEAPDLPRDPGAKTPLVETPNRGPRLQKITLLPATPTFEDTLTANVEAVDPDGNTPDVDYQWFVNDAEVLGFTQSELTPGHMGPGDKVRVHVVVSDGEASAEGDSSVMTIRNLAPTMVTEPRQLTRLDGFKMEAKDPEGEDLTWSVSGGPAGLSISPGGVLSYRGSTSEPGGTYTVTVRCDDPHGGWARIDVPITLSPGSAAPK